MSSFLWRTADTCVPLLQCKGTQVSAPRFPLQSFCRCCFVPAVFFRLIASKTALASHVRQTGFPLQSLSGGENIFFVLINHCLVFASNVFLPSFFLATFLIHNLPLYALFLLFKYTVRFFSIKIRG